MYLCDPSMEGAYLWLKRSVDSTKDKVDHLTWRIGTNELYGLYSKWQRQSNLNKISITDLWELIQFEFPWVKIVGTKGNRAYAGVRKKQRE